MRSPREEERARRDAAFWQRARLAVIVATAGAAISAPPGPASLGRVDSTSSAGTGPVPGLSQAAPPEASTPPSRRSEDERT